MKKTILAVGIACATMMAVAQSSAPQDNSAPTNSVVSPRDAATGMASGKRMHKPLTITKETEVSSPGVMVRESPSKASLGKTSVAADTEAKTKGSMSGANSNPMYQESGNSGTNPLYQGGSRNATKTRSNIQNNRVATSDVDGDGKADVAVTPGAAPAQMKGDFSRGHQPDRKAPAAANSSAPRDAQSGMATGKRQHD